MFKKAQKIFMYACAILALLMIIDYGLLTQSHTDKVVSTDKNLERYYNAGGNSHYSFRVQTKDYYFPATENFAKAVDINSELKLNISPIFNEVNAVENIATGQREVYSFRIFSGAAIPIILLIAVALGLKFGKRWNTLVFVSQVLLIANLVYLLN